MARNSKRQPVIEQDEQFEQGDEGATFEPVDNGYEGDNVDSGYGDEGATFDGGELDEGELDEENGGESGEGMMGEAGTPDDNASKAEAEPVVARVATEVEIELPPEVAALAEDHPKRRAYIMTEKLRKLREVAKREKAQVAIVKAEAKQRRQEEKAKREAEKEQRKAERANRASQSKAKKAPEPITSAEVLFKNHPTALRVLTDFVLPNVAEDGTLLISINAVGRQLALSRPSAKNAVGGLRKRGILELVEASVNGPARYRYHDVFATGQYVAPAHITTEAASVETEGGEVEVTEEVAAD